VVYFKLGKLDEALILSKQALEMNQILYKGNHPDVALSLNNLTLVGYKLGKLNETLTLFKQALEISWPKLRLYRAGISPNLSSCKY